MKTFQTTDQQGNRYEFGFVTGKLQRIVIFEGNDGNIVYGEYASLYRPSSQISIKHFETCFNVLCEDKNFNEYVEFFKELKNPANAPEFFEIAKDALLAKRKELITMIRIMTAAINRA